MTRRCRMKSKRRYSISAQLRASNLIYESVKSEDESVNKQRFIDELAARGILYDDPRISDLLKRFVDSNEDIVKNDFLQMIAKDIKIIERAFSNLNVIPFFQRFCDEVRDIYYHCLDNTSGRVSDKTPQLSKTNPEQFGVSICTTDGQRFNIGDTSNDFSLQSCVKPILYCMALEEHGSEIHNHVGHEPSGAGINALKLMPTGLPHNPLINSGAIVTCALIKQNMRPSERFDHVLTTWSQLAGGFSLAFSNPINLSLKNCSDREYALVHFLKENNAFTSHVDLDLILQFYFQVSALCTNSNYLSIVAGSLANGGVCPLTGKAVFSPETVKNCLSMMFTCGMYDYSGEFAFTVGLPACSGEIGAIMIVIPNVMGICIFSPRLDQYGNSTRGVEFISMLTEKFNFHMFDNINNTGDKEDPRKGLDREDATTEVIIRYASLGDLGALKRLNLGIDCLTSKDCDMRTALHLAASNGHIDVVEYIFDEVGVEHINPIDRWNGTPYDDAVREGYFEVATFLKSHGGKTGLVVRKEIIE